MSDNNYYDQNNASGMQYATFQAPDGSYYTQPVYYENPQQIQQYQTTQPIQQETSTSESTLGDWFNFRDSTYLKGFALGAGIALVASNPTVQKAVISGAVKAWAAVQGGFEEIKEQIQDAKAELSQPE
ncbi:hypothetical protein [Maridesulfovibrio bastinii]|uniref:hypothetical protein n=1 Tax=Maridesulfovibrio bastinii TaxID=47157 RepID=UPI00040EA514|nr:hypothetical protein [Maridesulfovibrio bastinii]